MANRQTFENVKWIPETVVYQERRVDRKTGRRVLDALVDAGEVDVLVTATNRRWLDYESAIRLAKAL